MPEPSGKDSLNPQRIMQMAWGYAPPLIIEAAIKHKIFDALDGTPKTIDEVSRATGASARGVRAILEALVGIELLSRDAQQRFALTPESGAFLVSTKPAFQGGIFKHVSSQLVPKWLELDDIVKTGRPARSVNEKEGAEFFEQFVEDIFPMSYAATQALAKELKVAEVKKPLRVLDIASGSGVWGIGLAQQSPQVRVTAVDWPGVLKVTKRVAEKFKVADRFTFVAGDMHEADFGSGHDVATLGHILHSDGELVARKLIGKVAAALSPGGTIAIAEFLTNDNRTGPPQSLLFAVNMLVNTDHGDVFSASQIGEWLREAGFGNVRTLEAPGPAPLVLATKK